MVMDATAPVLVLVSQEIMNWRVKFDPASDAAKSGVRCVGERIGCRYYVLIDASVVCHRCMTSRIEAWRV